MTRHVYDIKERADHEQVAAQLRRLADQIAKGRIEAAYDDLAEPLEIRDPIDLVLDIVEHRHTVHLAMHMHWPTGN